MISSLLRLWLLTFFRWLLDSRRICQPLYKSAVYWICKFNALRPYTLYCKVALTWYTILVILSLTLVYILAIDANASLKLLIPYSPFLLFSYTSSQGYSFTHSQHSSLSESQHTFRFHSQLAVTVTGLKRSQEAAASQFVATVNPSSASGLARGECTLVGAAHIVHAQSAEAWVFLESP